MRTIANKKALSDVALIATTDRKAYVMSAYYEGPADMTAEYSEVSSDYHTFSEIGWLIHRRFTK